MSRVRVYILEFIDKSAELKHVSNNYFFCSASNRAYCPANCSGRGRCRHGIVNGCDCFDPMDDSPFCANSPIVQPSQTPTASHAPSSVSETRTVSPSSSSSNAPSSFPSSFSPTDDFSQTKQPSKSPVVYSSTVNPTTISAANPVAAEDGDTTSEASRLILLNMSTLIMLSTVANYYFA